MFIRRPCSAIQQNPVTPVEFGLDLAHGLRTLSNLVPGHRAMMQEFSLYTSSFGRHAAQPLSESREAIANHLKNIHFNGRTDVEIEIVHPEKSESLYVKQNSDAQEMCPAVIRRASDGTIKILLSEAIFTAHHHADRHTNEAIQVKNAGRMIGVLMAHLKRIEEPHSFGAVASRILARDVSFKKRDTHDNSHIYSQGAVMYGFSMRRLRQFLKPQQLDRYLSWEHIERKIRKAFPQSDKDPLLVGTKAMYQAATREMIGAYWSFVKGRFVATTDPVSGKRVEAMSHALAMLGSFGNMERVDDVGQALILHYERGDRAKHTARGELYERASEYSKLLDAAMCELTNHYFEAPTNYDVSKADFTLASMLQRFVQTVDAISKRYHIRPENLCAMYLTTAYVKATHISNLDPALQEKAMDHVYLFDATLAERFACSGLADKMRYAAFSQCKKIELNKARDMLSGYLGMSMEAARKLERGLRSTLTEHSLELSERLDAQVHIEVRLKGYLSLHEKLDEIRLGLSGVFGPDKLQVPDQILKEIESHVCGYFRGSLDEREVACEAILQKWGILLDEHPDAYSMVRDLLDITDGIGVRVSCEDESHLNDISHNLADALNEQLAGGLNFHDTLQIMGIREIEEHEVVNSSHPIRAKITQGAVPWTLRRYALKIADAGEGTAWEVPIEVQIITEEELKKQKVGDGDRKYGFPHSWLKAARHVNNNLRRDGLQPVNEFSGVQMSFQDPIHGGTSFTEAFSASIQSITKLHLSVVHPYSSERYEIALPLEIPERRRTLAIAEIMGVDPKHSRVMFRDSITSESPIVASYIMPGHLYEIEVSTEPISDFNYPPVLPPEIIRRAFFISEDERQKVAMNGMDYLNQMFWGALHDTQAFDAQNFKACLESYVAAKLHLSSLDELSLYVGLLDRIIKNPRVSTGPISFEDAERALADFETQCRQLVGNFFEFPKVRGSDRYYGKEVEVSFERYYTHFPLAVARKIPRNEHDNPYSVVGGEITRGEDGSFQMRIRLDAPPEKVIELQESLKHLALRKGVESVIDGAPECTLELWLRERAGTFISVLESAHALRLGLIGWSMDSDSFKNETLPFKVGSRSGTYVPIRATFNLASTPNGSEKDLIHKIRMLVGQLQTDELLLMNDQEFIKHNQDGVMYPYVRSLGIESLLS